MPVQTTLAPMVDYVCAKCKLPNTPESRSCARCGSRLYLTCRRCHHRNPRTSLKCGRCGHRLRRSFLRRLLSKTSLDGKKIRSREIVLLLIILGLIYWYIQYISSTAVSTPLPPLPRD